MRFEFNADEILEIAERIEVNGANFYRTASKSLSNPEAVKMLENLAVMEDGHRKIFAEMRKSLPPKEKQSTLFDPENEIAKYLQAMADGYVFDLKSDPTKKLTGKETPEDILKTAIGLEKDSIVFYLGIKNWVPPELGKAKIDHIISEEMSHITLLSRELRSL